MWSACPIAAPCRHRTNQCSFSVTLLHKVYLGWSTGHDFVCGHSWPRSGWSGSFLVDFESLWERRPLAVLDHFTVNDFFISHNQEFLCCNLCLLLFVMPVHLSFHLFTWGSLKTVKGSLHRLLFWRLNKPSLQNSPHTSHPGSLSTLMVYGTHHNMLMSCTEAYSTVLQMQCHECQTAILSFDPTATL